MDEARSVAATDGEDIVVEVIKAIADRKEVAYTELDLTLSDVVDTDSLARLFESDPRKTPGCVSATVSVDGYLVSLQMQDAEEVSIEVTEPVPQAPSCGVTPATAETDVET